MGLQQKADINWARREAEEAWETWIKNEPVYNMKAGLIEIYAHALYVGVQRGRELERGA